MNLEPLPAFDDNYIWLLEHQRRAVVVDPGDATVVMAALTQRNLTLEAILITHHHLDHTGGLLELQNRLSVAAFAPRNEAIDGQLQRLGQGDKLELLGQQFGILDVPGHTAGHIAYLMAGYPGQSPILFCGDTLFSAGCGRLFEGTAAQMLASLAKIAALPDETQVACTHEYTLSNLRFANAVEPNNAALHRYTQHCQALRARALPTLPTTLAIERQINPFLRLQEASVRQAITKNMGPLSTETDYFAALREWKNNFK